MTAVELYVRADSSGDGPRGRLVKGELEGWAPERAEDVHDVSLRRHLMPLVMALRNALRAELQVELEQVVGVAEAVGVVGGTLCLLYTVPSAAAFDAQFGTSAGAPPPAWAVKHGEGGYTHLRSVRRVKSHFGDVPLAPPLQALCAARPFFTKPLLGLLQPLKKVAAGWAKEGAALPGRTWHYSRFPWRAGPPAGESAWCKTYFFYSSPEPTGPLHLYPLQAEASLNGDPAAPSGGGGGAFTPHYVESAVDWDAVPGDVGVLVVEDLMQDVAQFLLHEGWGSFCDLCAAHGLTAPTSDRILEIGLEKALIPLVHFAPLAPVVGFCYTHTFSSVPEPKTICLTAGAADLWYTPKTATPDAAHLLAVAQACFSPASGDAGTAAAALPAADVAALLEGVPRPFLEELARCRCEGLAEDTPAGAYLRASTNRHALEYLAAQGVVPEALVRRTDEAA